MDDHQALIDRQITVALQIALSERLKAQEEREMSERHWCAWISVDPRTSEVLVYPRRIARLIEYAQQEGRTEVFLGEDSMVGEGFYGATLFLSEDGNHYQRSARGGVRSVRRMCVESPR